MSTLRLFFAVVLPPACNAALAQRAHLLHRPVAEAGVDMGWVRQDNYHVTLKFLGAVDEDAVPAIVAAAQAVAARSPRLQLARGAIGAFPTPTRPRVLYAAVTAPDGGPPTGLQTLAAELEQALVPLGFATEERPFQPHLTLGRVRRCARGASLLPVLAGQRAEAGAPGPGQGGAVEEIVLYESQQDRSGVTYTPRAMLPLAR